MNNDKNYGEENMARLIRAGLGGSAQLDRQAREQTWRQLVAELRAGRVEPQRFPETLLAGLASLVVILAGWLLAATFGLLAPMSELLAGIAFVLVTVNLAMVPIASLVIILRRRYVE